MIADLFLAETLEKSHCLSCQGRGTMAITKARYTQSRNYRHLHAGGNQQLSNWISDPLSRREMIPGTENLVSFPGLMRSWALKNNLLLPLLLKPHSSFLHPKSYTHTDKCSYHPFWKNPYSKWRHYRKPHLDTRHQKTMGSLAPGVTSTSQLLCPWLREHPTRGRRKE